MYVVMKRILLATILVVELVIGVVLYYSFSEVYSHKQQPEPVRNIVRQLLSLQQSKPPPVSQSTSQLLDASTPSTAGSTSVEPTPQSSTPPLTLSGTVLRYFESLPNIAQPANAQSMDDRVILGRLLYFDQRLSVNGSLSCNSCHLLDQFGIDHRMVSLGHSGEPVLRNSPTVYNASLHIAQFWDGRSPTVESQAVEPIISPQEMGYPDAASVEKVIADIPAYRPYFERAFPEAEEPITLENIGVAIGAFERQLLTPSRFDRFLNGNWNEFTPAEFRGLGTFVEVGCTDCHQGVAIGGQLYKKLGVEEAYPTNDVGRYRVTRSESDRYVFKVPSLRNVAETAPYLHDGSIATLPEMVDVMARYQLGVSLTKEQNSDIVSFLQTLTGELPSQLITVPDLP